MTSKWQAGLMAALMLLGPSAVWAQPVSYTHLED